MFIKNKKFYIFSLIIIVFLFSSLAVRAMSGSKFKISITPAPECADGVDNDGDGLIDYPNDPDCASPSDDQEAVPVSPPGGGGGGGGAVPALVINPITSVSFSGRAYPSTTVKLLRDGELVASTISGKNADFQVTLQGLTPGNHLFSIYSEDAENRRSVVLPFNLFVAQGALIQLTGIFIPPTVGLNKTVFLPSEVINLFGQTVPQSQVSIVVHSNEELFFNTDSNSNGQYFYSFDASLLEVGQHDLKARSSSNDEVSDFSSTLNFRIGTTTEQEVIEKKADFDGDGRINLIDFSIAAFWYKKTVTSEVSKAVDLNTDGAINLIDFSIMAYYWTG